MSSSVELSLHLSLLYSGTNYRNYCTMYIINCLTFVQSRGRRRNAGLPFFLIPCQRRAMRKRRKIRAMHRTDWSTMCQEISAYPRGRRLSKAQDNWSRRPISQWRKNGDKGDECACREGRAGETFRENPVTADFRFFQTDRGQPSSEGPRRDWSSRVYRDAPRYLSRQLERHVTACCGSMVHARTRGVGMGYTCPI